MNEKKETFDTWALIELFGHQKIVGKVTEASLGGGAFLRVDVPAFEENKAYTRFYGPGAIYSISPIEEDVAMHLIKVHRNEPVQKWEYPQIADKVKDDGDGYEEHEVPDA